MIKNLDQSIHSTYAEGWISAEHAARACEKAFRRGFQQGWDRAFRCNLTPKEIERYSRKVADWRFNPDLTTVVRPPIPGWEGRPSHETILERLEMEYIDQQFGCDD